MPRHHENHRPDTRKNKVRGRRFLERAAPFRFRPLLERLEDRTLPATALGAALAFNLSLIHI